MLLELVGLRLREEPEQVAGLEELAVQRARAERWRRAGVRRP
jgi:hypothetical protein